MFILLLVVLLLKTSCAPASSFFFSNECGRCSGSRSPCRLVVFTVFSFVVAHTGCGHPPALTSMLNQSWNTPLVLLLCCSFSCSFNLLYFSFLKCAICFCCCSVFSFDLCFCVLPCVTSVAAVFLLFQRFLGILSSSGISILMLTFNRVVLSFHFFMIRILSKH